MKVLVTGGSGFIGSHVAEFLARKECEVVAYDNLSRARLLGSGDKHALHNWRYLAGVDRVALVKGDIRDYAELKEACRDAEVIVHTAAQTAVTASLADPRTDFEVNALGTINVLEAARNSNTQPAVVFCSTNKVYGSNVNKMPIVEKEKRYQLCGDFSDGIPETLSVDMCDHTPYGCSKLSADLYVQDYARTYGLPTVVFRMSCIYGDRQFGVEDQGWVAWFTIAAVTERPITIYGNGKQVRDLLYIDDLVKAFYAFLLKPSQFRGEVFNIGGGPEHTVSLLELLEILEQHLGKRIRANFEDWRPSDQRIYVSNIHKAKEKLSWKPVIDPNDGVRRLAEWAWSCREIL